jgi:hypothetical protein
MQICVLANLVFKKLFYFLGTVATNCLNFYSNSVDVIGMLRSACFMGSTVTKEKLSVYFFVHFNCALQSYLFLNALRSWFGNQIFLSYKSDITGAEFHKIGAALNEVRFTDPVIVTCIGIVIRGFDLVNNGFNGKKLIWTQDHHDFIGFVDHNVMRNHFTKCSGFKESRCELRLTR